MKLAHGQVDHLTEDAVVLEDGTELPADLVVYATGYGSMNGWAADLISQEVADKVGKVWGLGSDTTKDPGPWEGEQRNMWKPTQQENLWFHGGNLHQSRHYSLYLGAAAQGPLARASRPRSTGCGGAPHRAEWFRLSAREQVGVLLVPLDVGAHEGAGGDHVEAGGTHLVERLADQRAAHALALERVVDEGVGELDAALAGRELRVAGELAVDGRLEPGALVDAGDRDVCTHGVEPRSANFG